MGKKTYRFFKKIAIGKHPDFPKGATILPTYFESIEDSELEDLVGHGMDHAKKVEVDFGTGVKRQMVEYDDSLLLKVLIYSNLMKRSLI